MPKSQLETRGYSAGSNNQGGQRSVRHPSNEEQRKSLRSASLRNKSSMKSIHSNMVPVCLKQVKFKQDERPKLHHVTSGLQTSASSNQIGDVMALDALYQDILSKEREQFERILKSKVNIARSSTSARLSKHITSASEKYARVASLEKKLKMAKQQNTRLRQEWEKMKSRVDNAEERLRTSERGKGELKDKLEKLWEKGEEERDIVMMITKQEVEKQKDREIESVQKEYYQAQR